MELEREDWDAIGPFVGTDGTHRGSFLKTPNVKIDEGIVELGSAINTEAADGSADVER